MIDATESRVAYTTNPFKLIIKSTSLWYEFPRDITEKWILKVAYYLYFTINKNSKRRKTISVKISWFLILNLNFFQGPIFFNLNI